MQTHKGCYDFRYKNEILRDSTVAKEWLQSMSACGKNFVPVIQYGTFWSEDNEEFFFKHNLHDFVVGLKIGAFEIICQEILNGMLLFFSFQVWLLRPVPSLF